MAINIAGSFSSEWIRLEQREPLLDIPSPIEAATFIDEVMSTDPCIEKEDEETEELIDEEPLTLDEFDEIVKKLNYSICSMNNDTAYLEVEVHKSSDDPHVIKIIGGSVISEVNDFVEIDKTISFEDSSYLELQYRFNQEPSISLLGNVSDGTPVLSYENGIINFGVNTSGSIHIKGTATISLIEVQMDNVDDGCTVLAFFNEIMDEIDLDAPEIDESIEDPTSLCEYQQDLNVNPDDVECYKLETYLTKCKCSGTTIDRVTVEKGADCGDRQLSCPQNQSKCRKLVGSETYVSAYKDCGETTDEIDNAEFYEQKCCEAPDFILPKCETVTTIYRGGLGIKGGEKKYRSIYGENTRFIAVGPKGPNCGTYTVQQKLGSLNCCDYALPVGWNKINSPSVLGDHSSGIFYIYGGLGPFTYMSGQDGTYFINKNGDHVQSVESEFRYVTLFTEDVCGTLEIAVVDSCGSESVYTFRAVDGEWVQVESKSWNYTSKTGNLGEVSCVIPEMTALSVEGPDENTETWVVEESEDGWIMQGMLGPFRLTEHGANRSPVMDGPATGTCQSGEECVKYRHADYPYPPCLGFPAGGLYSKPICEHWDCALYMNGYLCCYECPGDYLTKYDKYGTVVCGTRTIYTGAVISQRIWEVWVC